MKSLAHLNQYFYRYRVRLLSGVAFVALSNYFAVVSVPYIRKGIDYVDNQITLGKTFSEAVHGRELIIFGLMFIGMAALNGLFMFFMRQTIIVTSRHIEFDLKNEIYDHYQELDVAFYKRNNTGDLMNRLSEDVSRVRMYVGPAVMYIINTLGTFIFTIVAMMNVDPKLTVYVLLPMPVLAFSIYKVSAVINRKSTKVQEQLSTISTHAQETFSGIKVVKAFSREEKNIEQLEEKAKTYRDRTLGLVRTEALFQPSMLLLIGLSTIITIYIGGSEAIDGRISKGNIAEFIVYINRLTWPIASLGWVTSLIQRAAASQTRINEFLRSKPAVVTGTEKKDRFNPVIELQNVDFVYPDSGIRALENISLKIEQGKTLGIMGHTGSGKSTISSLLTRQYDPTGGKIFLDEIEMKKIDLDWLRSNTGYVPQDVFLFSDSIRNNIAFGAKREVSFEEIRTAAKIAAIDGSVMQFPKQYDTVVGERGVTLSGGQKQRISIARAIVGRPGLLIFDDCLSAVDTETEEEILENLQSVMAGSTAVIISHRVSSVIGADHIILMENGRIAEEGNHESLIKMGGIYHRLHESQIINPVRKV